MGKRTKNGGQRYPVSDTEPDIDGILHANQFGTPQVTVMEIERVPEKKYLVTKLLQANGIAMWPDMTPFGNRP